MWQPHRPHDALRAFGSVPRNRGKNTTLIAGLALAGIQAMLILEEAVDTEENPMTWHG